MTEIIENLIEAFGSQKEFIVGRFITPEGLYINDRFELFITDFTMDVHKTAKDLRINSKLKVLEQDCAPHTLLVMVWKEHDCRSCGSPMNAIVREGKTVYFCAQCVKFK